METDIDKKKLEAEYEAYQQEWEKAMKAGKEFFTNIIKPFTSNVVDEETWLNGFVQGWIHRKF
jgi:hypothetical protein